MHIIFSYIHAYIYIVLHCMKKPIEIDNNIPDNVGVVTKAKVTSLSLPLSLSYSLSEF